MENLYNSIFIVDISQNPDESETITSRIQQLIEDHGGIIKKINRWGKKRLAYSIQKKSHGFYVEIEYSANSRLNIPKILDGEFRLNDRVLRSLTYLVEKRELIQREKKAVIKKEAEGEKTKSVPESAMETAKAETPPILPPLDEIEKPASEEPVTETVDKQPDVVEPQPEIKKKTGEVISSLPPTKEMEAEKTPEPEEKVEEEAPASAATDESVGKPASDSEEKAEEAPALEETDDSTEKLAIDTEEKIEEAPASKDTDDSTGMSGSNSEEKAEESPEEPAEKAEDESDPDKVNQ
jgi:small subunit ribosomal protein S6